MTSRGPFRPKTFCDSVSMVCVSSKGFDIPGERAVLYSAEPFRGSCIDTGCDCVISSLQWICTKRLHCSAQEEGPEKGVCALLIL